VTVAIDCHRSGKSRGNKKGEAVMTRAQTHSRSPLAVVRFSRSFLLLIASAVSLGIFSPSRTASAGEIPIFAVDASWPKQLPNNWILGQVGGITVDWQGKSG
jgi:hypothetical protein